MWSRTCGAHVHLAGKALISDLSLNNFVKVVYENFLLSRALDENSD